MRPDDIPNIPLHKDAVARVKDRSLWFGKIITAQAKIIAAYGGHNIVTRQHVDEAIAALVRQPAKRSPKRDIGLALGGVLAGVGGSAFLTELFYPAGPRPLAMGIFGVLVLIGVALVLTCGFLNR